MTKNRTPIGVYRQAYDPTSITSRYPPAGIGLLRAHEVFLPRRAYIVLEYAERLAIRSVDGREITEWWDLQMIKQTVWGDRFAIEIFPPMSAVIDKTPTRHLWSSHAVEQAAAAFSQKLHGEAA